MRAAGRWAWWNHRMPQPHGATDRWIRRAKEAKLDGVIVKARYWYILEAFQQVGIRTGVEVYTKPMSNTTDADALVEGIRRGAEFAVVNAEVEWEHPDSGEAMRQLCDRFCASYPDVEMYASVDTRGNRMSLPYQRVLSRYITGWMPMIYPKAFRPQPISDQQAVVAAFHDCLVGKDFKGRPVLPTIQTYGGVGKALVEYELAEVHERQLPGYQAYTIGHATNAEWAVIVNNAPKEEQMGDWLDSRIVGLDGVLLPFNVLQPDMTFKARNLTYKKYITLKVLGFLESDHSHTVKLV